MADDKASAPSLADLAVVVVNYGAHELLAAGLTAVAEALAPATIVVVDSFSSAPEREAVSALCAAHGWQAVLPDINTGFGGGCNLGVDAATARGATHFLLLNPDATIDRRSAELLLAAVGDGRLVLAAPRILRPDGSVWSAGTDLYLDTGDMRSWARRDEHPGARTMPWLTGACLAFDLALWRTVGGFDDDYFLYWEDVDFSARVLAAGGALRLVDDASAVHDEGGTHGEDGRPEVKSSLYYYYNIRNRFVYATKHLEPADRRRWRRSALPASWRIVTRGGRRQLLRSTAPWKAWWRGLRDGLRS